MAFWFHVQEAGGDIEYGPKMSWKALHLRTTKMMIELAWEQFDIPDHIL